ncbi:TRAP transporter substrate-binding protein DctP [bacterium]|nr:TRAP transporter substrate-binding protein DctP [bacterium]
MKTCNSLFLLVFSAIIFICLSQDSHCSAASKIRLKLATMAPDGSVWTNQIKLLNEELAEATDGRINFKVYPGGIMGDDDVVIRKIRVGQLDGAIFTTSALIKIKPDMAAIGFPGLFTSYEEVDQFLVQCDEIFNQHLRPKGYEVIGVMGLGFTYIFSKNPIRSDADMKSAKGWLWDNDVTMKTMYDQYGITPVSLGISDVMTALQTGLINTVFNTPSGILSMQWFTRVDEMLDFPLNSAFGFVILSKRGWKKIPDDLKPIVSELVKKHANEITRKSRIEDSKAREVLAERGVNIQKATPEFQTHIKLVIQKIIDSLLSQGVGLDIYNSIKIQSVTQE